MPAKAFSAPGPYCIAKTPAGFPFVTRAQPSAMWTPTRSWRQITGRRPPATAASMIGVVGKQNSVETPSRFKISVIASMTSIRVAPLWLGGGAAETSVGAEIAPAGRASTRWRLTRRRDTPDLPEPQCVVARSEVRLEDELDASIDPGDELLRQLPLHDVRPFARPLLPSS